MPHLPAAQRVQLQHVFSGVLGTSFSHVLHFHLPNFYLSPFRQALMRWGKHTYEVGCGITREVKGKGVFLSRMVLLTAAEWYSKMELGGRALRQVLQPDPPPPRETPPSWVSACAQGIGGHLHREPSGSAPLGHW